MKRIDLYGLTFEEDPTIAAKEQRKRGSRYG
jgi:hypothetical protein